jgi:hypothetical protein
LAGMWCFLYEGSFAQGPNTHCDSKDVDYWNEGKGR